MPLPPLSPHEWLNDPTTHLAKSGSAMRASANHALTPMAEILPRSIGGLPVEYDINYESPGLTIRGYKMTDLLTSCVWLAPANTNLSLRVFNELIQRGYTHEGMACLEETAKLSGDKYQQRLPKVRPSKLVVLPGSNLLMRQAVNLSLVDEAVEAGAYVKPHPITNALDLQRLQMRYKDRLLRETEKLHPLIRGADHVYVGSNSESGMAAIMYGKEYTLIDADKLRATPTYSAIYQALAKVQSPLTARQRLAALFSYPESGLYSIAHTNLRERIDQFIAYYSQFKHGR